MNHTINCFRNTITTVETLSFRLNDPTMQQAYNELIDIVANFQVDGNNDEELIRVAHSDFLAKYQDAINHCTTQYINMTSGVVPMRAFDGDVAKHMLRLNASR